MILSSKTKTRMEFDDLLHYSKGFMRGYARIKIINIKSFRVDIGAIMVMKFIAKSK